MSSRGKENSNSIYNYVINLSAFLDVQKSQGTLYSLECTCWKKSCPTCTTEPLGTLDTQPRQRPGTVGLINQPTNQPASQPTNQRTNPPTHQPTNPLTQSHFSSSRLLMAMSLTMPGSAVLSALLIVAASAGSIEEAAQPEVQSINFQRDASPQGRLVGKRSRTA